MAGFKTVIGRFVERHGFTYKSYFIALVVFPPAALFIPFKIAATPPYMRWALVILALAFQAVLIFVGVGAIFKGISALLAL